jgi:hypothetical protein
MNLRACGMRQKLRAKRDPEHGAVGRHRSRQRLNFFCEKRIPLAANVLHTHRPAEDDQQAKLVKIRWNLVPAIQMADFRRNSEVSEHRHDSPRTHVRDVLEDDRPTHSRRMIV